jgi:hypothetical protein
MNKLSLGVFASLAILIAAQSAPPTNPPSEPKAGESIKATRDKFDAELKADTKRPWDGMDLTGPHALEKREDRKD